MSLNDFVANISELTNLVNIRDSLAIEGLRGSIIESSKECPNDSYYYVSGMEVVEELSLRWAFQETDRDRDDVELLLFERLRPHSHLKKLSIYWYGGWSFPSWMMVNMSLSLPNLVEVTLMGCKRCQRLPQFGLLPSLQFLMLGKMDWLEYVYEEEDCGSSSVSQLASSPSKDPILFPSLKTLSFYELKQFKGVGRKRSRREVILKETTSSSSATEELSLTSSFGGIQHLFIHNCPQFDLLADGNGTVMQFQSLRSLTRLLIGDTNLVSLPAWLQYLTTLECLDVSQYPNLVALPELISNLTSLQHLYIAGCESLKVLPDCLGSLTTLKSLYIVGCPLLMDRCHKETGEDWPKIAHIPNIVVMEKW